jgi:Tfp pilus assembly protein PilF
MAFAQNADPGDPVIEKAYQELRVKHYDNAIAEFQRALAGAPDRPSVRKDLAYTLLKVGETEAARDQFAAALKLDPDDDHTALEYAFLCYETRQPLIARRVFDRLRKTGNQTAAQAFENIDGPLREGIDQWSQAVARSPDNFSAREELARLYEQHDQPAEAAEHYQRARTLRPDRRSLLVDLGRVWAQAGRGVDAMAALLAASRGPEPRVAEEARELLPRRYPFVYEFKKALDLDPTNIELRRELAYLYLEMSNRTEAEREFELLVKFAPDDAAAAEQLRTLRSRPAGETKSRLNDGEAKALGVKSLEKGYLKDALKYLQIALENDPLDFDAMLKLGWTYNLMKEDRAAIRWFELARGSPDAKIASEAAAAYRNLRPELERFRTTVWAAPMFSTRWNDLFAYAQVKTELRLPHWFVHPYVSLRFIGDTAGAVSPRSPSGILEAPQNLSERGAIAAIGASTNTWHGATGWFEAGEMFRYSPTPGNAGRAVPDYRGGISFARGIGGLLARGSRGWFAETNDDGIFVSRFGNDLLLYSQNRTGYTLPSLERTAALHTQVYWDWNVAADAQGQYWANTVETGPGVRFRFEGWRVPLRFSVDALRGAYLINAGNPRGPNFYDVRIGVWYVLSK